MTPAERRKAQRQLAADLKEGRPILPDSVKGTFPKEQLVKQIQELKVIAFGDASKFNKKRSDKAVAKDKDGQPRKMTDLRRTRNKLLNYLSDFAIDDLTDDDGDLDSALYYK